MSALPPEADMLIVGINVCFVPKSDIVGGTFVSSGKMSYVATHRPSKRRQSHPDHVTWRPRSTARSEAPSSLP